MFLSVLLYRQKYQKRPLKSAWLRRLRERRCRGGLLFLNVCYALTLYFLPLINVLYRPPFGGYAVMFRIKPMPLVSLNEQFRTKPSGGRSRPRQEGESAEWGGSKACLSINADFCGCVELVRCNSASKNQTALSYVFPNEPLPRWVGELLVLLFRDKSTDKKGTPKCAFYNMPL